MKKFLFLMMFLPMMVQATELRLLAWNVFMMPKPINYSLQPERSKVIAEKLKDSPYDVIVMSEAWIKSFRTPVGKALKNNFPYQRYLNRSVRPLHFMGSGLFVVSRLPFEVLDHWYYTRCTHSDCLSAKGVLLIQVAFPDGKQVQIAMSHLQAWDDKKAQDVRAYQFQEIKNLLNVHARPQVPQLLVGDLNIDGNATHEYPYLLNLMEMKARPLDGDIKFTNGFPTECFKNPGGNPNQWLDHVWINPRESGAQLIHNAVKIWKGELRGQSCLLSDHYSVEARIAL